MNAFDIALICVGGMIVLYFIVILYALLKPTDSPKDFQDK